jgi:hypothetical protein
MQPALNLHEHPLRGAPSSFCSLTIAAPCAGRTVASVIAIRACLRGEDPERKRSRQLQRGFEAAARTLSRDPGVRRRGLGTRTVDCFRGGAQGLWRGYPGGCGSQRRGRTGLSQALPPAVFPHPCRSPCLITIRHSFYSDACTVYRVPSNDL